jgi:prolyl-tRNA editing enzyme YbaK/EbsC (Cys-tRNA(Pro) deacylase)
VSVELPRSARRVAAALAAAGLAVEVVELPDSARTAPEAASAVGVPLGAIVKSLVFRGPASGEPLLALVSGDRRADEGKLVALASGGGGAGAVGGGAALERADADYVRSVTGYSIGGVPPLGHPEPLRTFMDEGLWRFPEVWAAAGTPHAVFGVAPADLARAIGVGPSELT